MGFLKKNLFWILCGAGAVAGLGLMFWGMARSAAVKAEMEQVQGIQRRLEGFQRSPANTEAVDAERERIDKVMAYHREVLGHFDTHNRREPLLADLLPDPPPDRSTDLRYEFQRMYRSAMNALLDQLKASTPPTPEDVENTADFLRKKELESTPLDGAGARAAAPAQPAGLRPPGVGTAAEPLPEPKGPESAPERWKALEERAKVMPDMLASIGRARQIRCYADPLRSFTLHPIYQGKELAPSMQEVWLAQLWYWIQKDIVNALARVNDEAAAGLQETAWVGNMPIKDIVGIRISNYIVDQGDKAQPRAQEPGAPPSAPGQTFTGQASTALYDVLNVSLQIVIDIRDLQKILHALCDETYYVPLNVNYEAVPPDDQFDDKVYGPEPIARVTIDLQTYLCYKSFVPLMPQVVRASLGIPDDVFNRLIEERAAERGEPPAEEPPAEGGA